MSAAAGAARCLAGAGAVWLRNATVWARSWRTSLVGSVGEPLFLFLGLGYGLGTLVPEVGGVPYLRFVAPGIMVSSVMQSATIEATYGAFTKLEHQRVYASMILSPLVFADVVLGEILWAVTKGVLSGGTVLALMVALGIAPPAAILPGVALLALAGLVFAALGLTVTALARGYDFFNYYFTLFISPMFFFSGIFFPVERLGPGVALVAEVFPLTHLVALSRSLFAGRGDPLVPLAGTVVFAAAAVAGAVALLERRFSR